VLLIHWRTDTDEFEEGQWLKGRIYERRCDLSPDGSLLVYFAATHKKPFGTWTAISKPPFLTALALWPKGDAWGGGGLFESKDSLLLNHWPNQFELAPDFKVPGWLRISPLGRHTGWGEDEPIWSMRLLRDGWTRGDGWERRNPRNPDLLLRMLILRIAERGEPWYVIEHELVDTTSGAVQSLGRSDWADWDRSGDLLFAKEGKIFRLPHGNEPRQIADLSEMTFEPREPAASAKTWPEPLTK